MSVNIRVGAKFEAVKSELETMTEMKIDDIKDDHIYIDSHDMKISAITSNSSSP